MTKKTQKEQLDLEPLLNVYLQQLGLVIDEANSTDSKALALLGANIALMIYIGQAGLHISSWWQGFTLIAPQIAALIFIGAVIWPREYWGPATSTEKISSSNSQDLIRQLLADTADAISNNTQHNHIRWKLCMVSVTLMLIGLISLFAIM